MHYALNLLIILIIDIYNKILDLIIIQNTL